MVEHASETPAKRDAVDLDTIDAKLDILLSRIEPAHRRFLTIASAAVYTDLSEPSIRRLLAAGRLTSLRPVRGRVLIDRRALDALVLASTQRLRRGRGLSQLSGSEERQ